MQGSNSQYREYGLLRMISKRLNELRLLLLILYIRKIDCNLYVLLEGCFRFDTVIFTEFVFYKFGRENPYELG